MYANYLHFLTNPQKWTGDWIEKNGEWTK